MAIVINAAPASLVIKIALISVSEVPSNIETTQEGIIANANPVTPSMSAVIVNTDFIFFEVYTLVSLKSSQMSTRIISLDFRASGVFLLNKI